MPELPDFESLDRFIEAGAQALWSRSFGSFDVLRWQELPDEAKREWRQQSAAVVLTTMPAIVSYVSAFTNEKLARSAETMARQAPSTATVGFAVNLRNIVDSLAKDPTSLVVLEFNIKKATAAYERFVETGSTADDGAGSAVNG